MKRTTSIENQELNEIATSSVTAGDNVLSFSATLRELRTSVDADRIRQRATQRDQNGNVRMVEYVEWHTVADVLDEKASNWVHEVKSIQPIGDIVTVTVAITIDGITREGIGTGRAVSETGIKKAEHDALKRAAVKFGIARELYKREFDTIEQSEFTTSPSSSETSSIGPMAGSLGDMVTAKQLGLIRGISREANIDTEKECVAYLGCAVDELSKRSASEFIDHLMSLQRETTSAPMRRAG